MDLLTVFVNNKKLLISKKNVDIASKADSLGGYWNMFVKPDKWYNFTWRS